MSQIKLAFVANDGVAYAPDTEIGKQLGFITWTPSKIRVILPSDYNNKTIHISQESLHSEELKGELNSILESLNKENIKYETPEVLFYNNLEDEGCEKIELTGGIEITKYCQIDDVFEEVKSIEFYVAGKFQTDVIYGGASPQEKDIQINTWYNDEPKAVIAGEDKIPTMIRVRRNANELTKKAKADYLQALSKVNMSDIEGRAYATYSRDFFKMHTEGALNNAHFDAQFFAWHRLFLLDLERLLQKQEPTAALHYWKFDEPAPNIFKEDFLGKTVQFTKEDGNIEKKLVTESFSNRFAVFSDDNPLRKWAINKEKLLRRSSFFDNEKECSNTDIIFFNVDGHMKSEYDIVFKSSNVLGRLAWFDPRFDKADKDELGLEIRKYEIKDKVTNKTINKVIFDLNQVAPHGTAHISFNGPINNVPTAVKDPLFFFLHCNMDRLWAKWQTRVTADIQPSNSKDVNTEFIGNRYDAKDVNTYPYQDTDLGKNELLQPVAWKRLHGKQWPWSATESSPGKLTPPGTRQHNHTPSLIGKKFDQDVPMVIDAIDAFGSLVYDNYLGFGYDDNSAFTLEMASVPEPKIIEKQKITFLNSSLVNPKFITIEPSLKSFLKDHKIEIKLSTDQTFSANDLELKNLEKLKVEEIIVIYDAIAKIDKEFADFILLFISESCKIKLYTSMFEGFIDQFRYDLLDVILSINDIPKITELLNKIALNTLFSAILHSHQAQLNKSFRLLLNHNRLTKVDKNYKIVRTKLSDEEVNRLSSQQKLRNKLYIHLSQNGDAESVYELERMFEQMSENIKNPIEISKDLLVYLLADNDHEYISDFNVLLLIEKNQDIFDKLTDPSYLNLFVTLLSYLSNTSIIEVYKLMNTQSQLENTVKDFESAYEEIHKLEIGIPGHISDFDPDSHQDIEYKKEKAEIISKYTKEIDVKYNLLIKEMDNFLSSKNVKFNTDNGWALKNLFRNALENLFEIGYVSYVNSKMKENSNSATSPNDNIGVLTSKKPVLRPKIFSLFK